MGVSREQSSLVSRNCVASRPPSASEPQAELASNRTAGASEPDLRS